MNIDLFLDTRLACAVESQFVTIHGDLILLTYRLSQIFCQFQAVQIRHTAALGTDKVSVGFCSPIETLLTVDDPYTFDYALFLEEQQITVDGAKAQVWVLRLQRLIQPLCSGVAVCLLNNLKKRFSFFAISYCFCHTALLFIYLNDNNYCLRHDNSICHFVCKEEISGFLKIIIYPICKPLIAPLERMGYNVDK